VTRKLPFTAEEFRSIYSRVPRLCVDLIIQNDQGVLLTLRQKHGWIGQWHFPGGTVFYQEGIDNAIKRIAQEELGIKVKVIKFLRYVEYFSEQQERGFGNSVSLVFVCWPLSTKFVLDQNVSEAKFFRQPPASIVAEHRQLFDELHLSP
jgi:ADP-ribose pyrophosphatase YjhB (NUDIX family)